MAAGRWSGRRRRRARRWEMAQPVVHFEIIGEDPARLREYFSELFGWSFARVITRSCGCTIA
jgi:predicted enzyme related to lactoylglutathione lyase